MSGERTLLCKLGRRNYEWKWQLPVLRICTGNWQKRMGNNTTKTLTIDIRNFQTFPPPPPRFKWPYPFNGVDTPSPPHTRKFGTGKIRDSFI
jgi:hypothetical protein